MQSKINHLLNQIYNTYKDKVEDASDLWKSEFSCSKEQDIERDKSDKEDLLYFEGLLREIDNDFIPLEEN